MRDSGGRVSDRELSASRPRVPITRVMRGLSIWHRCRRLRARRRAAGAFAPSSPSRPRPAASRESSRRSTAHRSRSRRPAGQPAIIAALTNTATAITGADYPYVWGGGHAEAGIASIGIRGPGYNGRRTGSTARRRCRRARRRRAVAGGKRRAQRRRRDRALRQEHLLAQGAGKAPIEVTLYDDPGVHIFMNINGRFWGTSDGGNGGDAKGGPGWLSDRAPDAYNHVFKQYHLVSTALKATDELGPVLHVRSQFEPRVDRRARGRHRGAGDLQRPRRRDARTDRQLGRCPERDRLGPPGLARRTATFTVVTAAGTTVTLSAAADPALLSEVQPGDTVTVAYGVSSGMMLVQRITVTATPTLTQSVGAITAIASDGSVVHDPDRERPADHAAHRRQPGPRQRPRRRR